MAPISKELQSAIAALGADVQEALKAVCKDIDAAIPLHSKIERCSRGTEFVSVLLWNHGYK